MQEIEVKILEVDLKKIEETLTRKGAKKVFDGEITTLFFDFEDHRIINAKDVLRLREEREKTELTYKKVHASQSAKTAEEYSVEVSSLDATRKILESLGLAVMESMQKHRVSYKLGDARFDIDRYSGDYSFIPEFLEIEAQNIDEIYRNAALLGFTSKDCLPWSTNELIQHYSGSKGKAQKQ